jgi:hypothetical protein
MAVKKKERLRGGRGGRIRLFAVEMLLTMVAFMRQAGPKEHSLREGASLTFRVFVPGCTTVWD